MGASRWRRTAALTVAVATLSLGVLAVRVALRSRSPADALPADPLATMDPARAIDLGVALAQQRRYLASLPYFRRAAAASDGWQVHWNFAAALNNAAFEVRSRSGVPSPASRTALERVELARQALAEVARAERLVPDRRSVARMEMVRGQTLELWGFPLDALETYRRAALIDSTLAAAREKEAECLERLGGVRSAHAPVRSTPAP